MAKVKLGPMAGQVSGSIGATTFSHNRYGTYIRRRAIPVTSTTPNALAAKARLSTASAYWGNTLTAGQRLSWGQWAQSNPITDALGDKQILDGHTAFVQLTTRLLQAGISIVATPPITNTPDPLTTLTASFDIGAGDFDIDFTPTPIGATKSIWIQAAVTPDASIQYVKNLLRVVKISAANQATGYDPETDVEAVFGTLTVGMQVAYLVSVLDRASGLLSAPMRVAGVVVST